MSRGTGFTPRRPRPASPGWSFTLYNITKRPGGVSWQNLFYAAPIGAPAALTLAGLLGRGAERVRETPLRQRATVLGLPAGRVLAAMTAAGLAGTVGEAGLLHFRGAYQNPAMFIPVTLPPVAAALARCQRAEAKSIDHQIGALVAATDGAARIRRRRLSCLWHFSRHGRMAQLESERRRRTAVAGAAELYRARPGRSCRVVADRG